MPNSEKNHNDFRSNAEVLISKIKNGEVLIKPMNPNLQKLKAMAPLIQKEIESDKGWLKKLKFRDKTSENQRQERWMINVLGSKSNSALAAIQSYGFRTKILMKNWEFNFWWWLVCAKPEDAVRIGNYINFVQKESQKYGGIKTIILDNNRLNILYNNDEEVHIWIPDTDIWEEKLAKFMMHMFKADWKKITTTIT